MKKRVVFIIVIIILAIMLTSCAPLTPEELVDNAKTTWGNAYARTIKDTLTIEKLTVTAPINALLMMPRSISTLITIELSGGVIEMERKISGNTYYLEFIVRNLKGKLKGDMAEVIKKYINFDNIGDMEVRMSGKLIRDKVTLTTVVTGLDKISDGAPDKLENVIFDDKIFEPVVTSVIKMLMQQNLFGSIPSDGVIDADNNIYRYGYDNSDKINSEFMRLPKLVVDAIKDINFKTGWRTLAEILNNNFDTTDFVKIAKQYIMQDPVNISCAYTQDNNGLYFNKIESAMSMSIPKLPKYFFGQILELIGVTGIEITDDCSAQLSFNLKTDMAIDKANASK